jgi:hypothetical protein
MAKGRVLFRGAQIVGGGTSVPAIDKFVVDFLPFLKRAEARPFNGRNMHENVFVTLVGFDETKSLGWIKPFYCTGTHELLLEALAAIIAQAVNWLTPGHGRYTTISIKY